MNDEATNLCSRKRLQCVLLTEESDDGPWENLAFELFEESFGKEKLSKQVQDLSYVRIIH